MVCQSVCYLVSPARSAEAIEMPFVSATLVGPGKHLSHIADRLGRILYCVHSTQHSLLFSSCLKLPIIMLQYPYSTHCICELQLVVCCKRLCCLQPRKVTINHSLATVEPSDSWVAGLSNCNRVGPHDTQRWLNGWIIVISGPQGCLFAGRDWLTFVCCLHFLQLHCRSMPSYQ